MLTRLLKTIFPLLLCAPIISFAQSSQQDTTFLFSSVIQAKKMYAQTIQGQARLYNGSDYLEYRQTGEEHPYYLENDWVLSTVQYSGEYFENVPIYYDLTTDKIITEHYYSSNKMQLVSELVSSFTFHDRLFVRLITNESKGISLKTGFYEVLYSGQLMLYAKHMKSYYQRIQFEELVVSFVEKNRYYIYKNNVFYEVSSKSTALHVLSDKGQELKHYLKKNHIKFKSDPETALVAMMKYYDTITQ
jgi:hypothetical protein